MVLIHEQQPELFDIAILQDGVHVVVDASGRSQVGALLRALHLSALAQFAGGQNGDGLGLAHTLVLAELSDGHLAQRVEVVVAVAQNFLHQIDSTHTRGARTHQDCQQLSIAECCRALLHEFLARAILLSPIGYGKFLAHE